MTDEHETLHLRLLDDPIDHDAPHWALAPLAALVAILIAWSALWFWIGRWTA